MKSNLRNHDVEKCYSVRNRQERAFRDLNITL